MARAKSAGAEPDLATRLDLERTHIAYEQSMMTWIRTAITLITFGFTIYKFFQLELPGRAEKSRLWGLASLHLYWLLWVSFRWRWRRWSIGAVSDSSSSSGLTHPGRWRYGWPP